LKAEFPEGIIGLFNISGLGPKKIAALYHELGVGSVADLKRVCESGEAAKLSGFVGEKTVREAAGVHRLPRSARERVPQPATSGIAVEQVLSALRDHPNVSRVEVCGSYRRGKEVVHDLDFLAESKKRAGGDRCLRRAADVSCKRSRKGGTKASVRTKDGLQCDLRVVASAEYPVRAELLHRQQEHNVAIAPALHRSWAGR